jgi:hypothetical protein
MKNPILNHAALRETERAKARPLAIIEIKDPKFV